jgi:hypothetical protein
MVGEPLGCAPDTTLTLGAAKRGEWPWNVRNPYTSPDDPIGTAVAGH